MEIASFFEQFGRVTEAKLARNYYGTLFIHKKQAELEEKYDLEKRKVLFFNFDLFEKFFFFKMEIKANVKGSKKLKYLERRIAELKKKNSRKIIEKFQRNIQHDQYPSIKAFVLFDSMQVRNKVVDFFRNLN
jgi:hypothetical protein